MSKQIFGTFAGILLGLTLMLSSGFPDRAFAGPYVSGATSIVVAVWVGVLVWKGRNRDLMDIRYRAALVLFVALVGFVVLYRGFEIAKVFQAQSLTER